MTGNIVYLYLTSPLQVLLTELEELETVSAYDLAKASADEVISLDKAITGIEQEKSL